LLGFEKYTELNIEIAGHTDIKGNSKSNLKLSRLRSKKIKSFLVENGVVENKLSEFGYGDTKPLSPHSTQL